VQDTIEPFDLLDRELLAVGTQVKGELIDFALCEWVYSHAVGHKVTTACGPDKFR